MTDACLKKWWGNFRDNYPEQNELALRMTCNGLSKQKPVQVSQSIWWSGEMGLVRPSQVELLHQNWIQLWQLPTSITVEHFDI